MNNDSMKLVVKFHLLLNLDGEEKTYEFETQLTEMRELDSITKLLLSNKQCRYIETVRID